MLPGQRATGQIKAFTDTWRWDLAASTAYDELVRRGDKVAQTMRAFRQLLGTSDMLAYLAMMAPRLVELHRVLKPTGSFYLHCDPAASHYLKLVLDAIFGPGHFRSEIVWKRTSAHSGANRYGPVHDVILFYTKSDRYVWHQSFQPYSAKYLDGFYTHRDADGRRWRRSDLTAAGVRHGESGKPWRGIDVTAKGRHWAVPADQLDELDRTGKIHWPKKAGGMPMLKRYADEQPGVPLQDVWTDIPPMHNRSSERLGYPTQKPLALLERIIKASSNEGEVVLDAFCGCGTAIAAAHALGRHWIGIDITYTAITVIRNRLDTAFGPGTAPTPIGEPATLDDATALAQIDRYQFEAWALGLVGALSAGKKKGADQGIDGRLLFDETGTGDHQEILFSVKSGLTTVRDVRELWAVVEREGATMGVLITQQQPTRAMKHEAMNAGTYYSATWDKHYPRLQLLTIEDLLAGKKVDCPPLRQINRTFPTAPRQGRKEVAEQRPLVRAAVVAVKSG